MSAIWGMIDLSGGAIGQSVAESMTTPYRKYRIDEIKQLEHENVYMACGLQYIDSLARREQLPYHDAQRNIYFTADCMLDNREELIAQLGAQADATDGELLYRAYLQWGEECSAHVLGAYAYAVYDAAHGKVIISADHVFNRSIFYRVRDNKVWFSTLLRPIYEMEKEHLEWNERWLVDCITLKAPVMITEPIETYYQDVYKIEAGTYIVIQNGKIHRHRYWNPCETFHEQKWDETYCKQRFRELFQTCVRSTIRTDGEVGILLSSGLDSNAEACTAAPMLAEQHKKLYSFTSVPEQDFVSHMSKRYIANETEGVLETCKMYSNIEPMFLDCHGKSILSEYPKLVDILEMPTKSQQNAVWLQEAYEQAHEKGCRIMLTGQSGNCLISAGKVEETLYRYWLDGSWLKFYRELKMYAQHWHVSRKKALFVILRDFKNSRQSCRKTPITDVYEDTCINRSIAEQYQTARRFQKKYYNVSRCRITEPKEFRDAMYVPMVCAQCGEYVTKSGLAAGIVIRDPIQDKRMIELFLQIPQEYYAKDGINRRLVREYMKDILPQSIASNDRSRGYQSADNEKRISKALPICRQEVFDKIQHGAVSKYTDAEQIRALCKELSNHGEEDMTLPYWRIGTLLTMSELLEKWNLT